MLVKMLKDVVPEDYDMKGQYGWASEAQYKAGEICDIEDYFACLMINNDDAERYSKGDK